MIPQQEEKYSAEELQLMKTQDIKYVQMKLSTEKKVGWHVEIICLSLCNVVCQKIERLQASLHQIERGKGGAPNFHVKFVDSAEEGWYMVLVPKPPMYTI